MALYEFCNVIKVMLLSLVLKSPNPRSGKEGILTNLGEGQSSFLRILPLPRKALFTLICEYGYFIILGVERNPCEKKDVSIVPPS